MLNIIHDLAPALWQLLPEATIGLRFGAALIGFALAVGTLIRRLRRPQRTPLSPESVVNPERERPDQQVPVSRDRSKTLKSETKTSGHGADEPEPV